MEADQQQAAERLFDEQFITEKELAEVKAYRSLGIFSLHNELQFLLYLAVLLFTSGAGIIIYKNIDTIGHTVILTLLLAVCGICYYFCFKQSKGFSREETDFEHPVYHYLVLLATILSCIFIGYLQFQYAPFGENIEIPTLISALIAFATAYYFDNRSALSIGITGLAAAIGITVTPQALLENGFFDHPSLFYYGVALGFVLAGWSEYSERTNLKKHFTIIYNSFAQHLIGICCLTGMTGDYWLRYLLLLAVGCYWFYRKSHALHATSIFVFVLVYGYIGFNILIFSILEFTDAYQFYEIITIVSPVYVIGSILLFIRSIKRFNRETHDSAQ